MKICSACNKENSDVKGNYCIFCGGKLIKKTNNNKKLIITLIILIIMLIIVSGIAIYLKISDNTSELIEEISELNEQISNLEVENNKLSSENSSLNIKNIINSEKIDFFDENIVFVLDGYGKYYYTYEQMEQVTQGKTFTYWAYNLEQAKDLGYKAWK